MSSEKGKKDPDALLLGGVGHHGTAGGGGCMLHKSSSKPNTKNAEYLMRDSSANNGVGTATAGVGDPRTEAIVIQDKAIQELLNEITRLVDAAAKTRSPDLKACIDNVNKLAEKVHSKRPEVIRTVNCTNSRVCELAGFEKARMNDGSSKLLVESSV